ncbi:hypothetical protein COCNU_06G008810 [Cocos nucifera]|uniref:Uncharacterized protein n=1 Tax=Cocos nucifera TaxID=13894 RepID=A0A8K0IBY8_COCNU|nr:hypothetical protein COCNU_06G008810 [Cocos nucifera]
MAAGGFSEWWLGKTSGGTSADRRRLTRRLEANADDNKRSSATIEKEIEEYLRSVGGRDGDNVDRRPIEATGGPIGSESMAKEGVWLLIEAFHGHNHRSGRRTTTRMTARGMERRGAADLWVHRRSGGRWAPALAKKMARGAEW